jgi:hypothetical protein
VKPEEWHRYEEMYSAMREAFGTAWLVFEPSLQAHLAEPAGTRGVDGTGEPEPPGSGNRARADPQPEAPSP